MTNIIKHEVTFSVPEFNNIVLYNSDSLAKQLNIPTFAEDVHIQYLIETVYPVNSMFGDEGDDEVTKIVIKWTEKIQ